MCVFCKMKGVLRKGLMLHCWGKNMAVNKLL